MSRDFKLFFQYIMPSMGGMLIAGTFSVVDTFFVGKAMGDIGLAAIALTWPLMMLFGAFGDMFGTGAAIIVAQSRGAGDVTRARSAFGNMLWILSTAGIVVTLLVLIFLPDLLRMLGAEEKLYPFSFSYSQIMTCGCIFSMFDTAWISVIRNEGRPVLAMWLIVGGLLGNIVLDYIFIFPCGMGVAGAAVATVISQLGVALVGAVYFLSKYTTLKPNRQSLKLNWPLQWEIIKNGIPTLGNHISIIVMLLFHNIQSLRYGNIPGLAAYTLIAVIESIGSLLMTGLSAGVQPLVAYFYGSGKHRRKRRIGKYGYWTAFWGGLVMMVVSILGHGVFPGWFGLSGDVAALAGHGLILSASAFLFLGVVRVAGYYFQSTGMLKKASILIYGDSFFALPLCLFVLPLIWGLDGVWLAMPISRAMLFGIVCWFWFGNKWQRKENVNDRK